MRLSTVIVLSSFLLLVWVNSSQAFGVSPPFIKEEYLLPGSHFEKTIYLIQQQTSQDYQAELSFSPEIQKIRDWISIDKGDNFTISANTKQFPLVFTIDVPSNVKLKRHKGYVWISGKSGGNGQVANIGGGTIELNLNVGKKEYSDWQLRGLEINDLAKNQKTIQVVLKIENLGNTEIRPSKVHLDVYDNWHKDLLASGDKTNLPYIAPFQTKDIIAEFPVNLTNGQQYWGEIKIYKDNKLLLADKRRFNVGTISTTNNSSQINPNTQQERAKNGFAFNFLRTKIAIYFLAFILIILGAIFGIKKWKESGIILEFKVKKKSRGKSKKAKTLTLKKKNIRRSSNKETKKKK